MATRGGQPGNNNATKNKPWHAAINRALAKRSRVDQKEAIDALAEKFLDMVASGDLGAFKEFGDRVDGKPAQSVTLAGDEENPLIVRAERVIVNPSAG